MKIAFITSSLAGGGAERVVSILANSFCNYKDVEEVSVVALIENKVTYSLSNKIRYYYNDYQKCTKIKRMVQRYNYLKRILKQIKADVVISFCAQINIYSILVASSLSIKLIISERNDPNNDPIQVHVRKFRDFVYRFSEAAVFQTPDAASYFAHIIKGKSTVIMNPITSNLPLRYKGERSKKIVSVGRLTTVKNHSMLINAFYNFLSKHQDYVLEIYGDGPEKDNLQKQIEYLKLNNNVFLRGFSVNLYDDIISAACFVLASNYEGISNAMLEALGLGIPTICTDCPIGGARMVIESNINGLLIPVGDQFALENALAKVIDDKNFSNQLSENAVKINDEFSSERICAQWLKFIRSVMY